MSLFRCLQTLALIASLGIVGLSGQVFGQTAPPPTETRPKALGSPDRGKITFAEQRGGLIFRLDRAAWISTEAFRPVWRNQPGVTLRGWVVEEFGDQRLVTFYGKRSDALIALARFGERDGRITTRAPRLTGSDEALSEAERKLVNARELVLAFSGSPEAQRQNIRPCTAGPFNSVVIPTPNDNGNYEVYLMTSWLDRDSYPMGGHFRVLVPEDGPARLDRAFTTSCLNLPTSQAGAQATALVLSHILDPQPTEIHVFAAQTLRLPVYVGIGSTVFSVRGNKIAQERN